MNKEKVEEWISNLANNCKERMSLAAFGDGVFTICGGTDNTVHLHRSARIIAELLGLSYKKEILRYKDGHKKLEVSFLYNDVKFFSLEDCDA